MADSGNGIGEEHFLSAGREPTEQRKQVVLDAVQKALDVAQRGEKVVILPAGVWSALQTAFACYQTSLENEGAQDPAEAGSAPAAPELDPNCKRCRRMLVDPVTIYCALCALKLKQPLKTAR